MSIHPPIHDGKLLSDEQKRLNVQSFGRFCLG